MITSKLLKKYLDSYIYLAINFFNNSKEYNTINKSNKYYFSQMMWHAYWVDCTGENLVYNMVEAE